MVIWPAETTTKTTFIKFSISHYPDWQIPTLLQFCALGHLASHVFMFSWQFEDDTVRHLLSLTSFVSRCTENGVAIFLANFKIYSISTTTIMNSQALSKMIKMYFLSRKPKFKSECGRSCNLLRKITTQATSIKCTTEITNRCMWIQWQISSFLLAKQKQPEMTGQFIKQKQTNS